MKISFIIFVFDLDSDAFFVGSSCGQSKNKINIMAFACAKCTLGNDEYAWIEGYFLLTFPFDDTVYFCFGKVRIQSIIGAAWGQNKKKSWA